MRRLIALMMLALSVLACTLTDDFMGDTSAVPPANYDTPDLPIGRAPDGAFTMGFDDAPITIIVFADWYCPHCQNYKPTVDRLIEVYVMTGQARYEHRFFPTAGGEHTVALAKWAECAAESGINFFDVNNALYETLFNGFVPAQQLQPQLADRFGLKPDKMTDCIESATQVIVDGEFARNLGVTGTPSVWVRYGDGRVEQATDTSFDGLRDLIEEAGGQASQPTMTRRAS